MEYFVPQIEHKLKIFGPFGFKEFIILLVCFGISIILHQILPFVLFILISILIFALAFAFIFIKVDGFVLERYLQNVLFFLFVQKNYFWRRNKTEIKTVRVISKQKQKEKERLYQVVKEGALASLSNQINLGVEVKGVSQKAEKAWKELLKLDEVEKKQDKFELLQKNKKAVEAQKAFAIDLQKKQKIEIQTKLQKAYKDLEKIGEKRIEKEQKRQQIEERLKVWTQRKKPVEKKLEEMTKMKSQDIGIKKDISKIQKRILRKIKQPQKQDESELLKKQEIAVQDRQKDVKDKQEIQKQDESELKKILKELEETITKRTKEKSKRKQSEERLRIRIKKQLTEDI